MVEQLALYTYAFYNEGASYWKRSTRNLNDFVTSQDRLGIQAEEIPWRSYDQAEI